MAEQLRLLVVGAHPDDCDIRAGGLACLYATHGHKAKFVSVTNGDAGHHEIGGLELAQRRNAEAQAVATVAGIEYQLLDNHDGELVPTLENRRKLIRIIREFKPDLILTHRPNDYHPDHRYTSILVQDSAYMVTVPNVCSLVPHLQKNPAIAYVSDGFQKPQPFAPTVVIDVDSVNDTKFDMLHCHESQVYEWLPYNGGYLETVPGDRSERRSWLEDRWGPRLKGIADKYREKLIRLYGEEHGKQVVYAEAFEACEYGSSLTEERMAHLFPFLP